jgi:hypothetical protein
VHVAAQSGARILAHAPQGPAAVFYTRALDGGLGETRRIVFVWKARPGQFARMINDYEKAEGRVTHMWFAENGCVRPYRLREVPGGSDETQAPACPTWRVG